MKTNIGLWIDQRKAVIVLESSSGEEIKVILSDVDRQSGRIHGQRSNAPHEVQTTAADDVSERKFKADLHRYYDKVIACIRDAKRILIFGPGEAKGHLKKQLEDAMPKGFFVDVETTDKMTDRQIAAKVREYFERDHPVLLSEQL
ncbi:MAG: hypothetical protein ABL974_20125 [Prosthecobacter sp.]